MTRTALPGVRGCGGLNAPAPAPLGPAAASWRRSTLCFLDGGAGATDSGRGRGCCGGDGAGAGGADAGGGDGGAAGGVWGRGCGGGGAAAADCAGGFGGAGAAAGKGVPGAIASNFAPSSGTAARSVLYAHTAAARRARTESPHSCRAERGGGAPVGWRSEG